MNSGRVVRVDNARVIELTPIPVRPSEFEEIEKRIRGAFRDLIYKPVMREFGYSVGVLSDRVTNADGEKVRRLSAAIASGRVNYEGGVFSGRFSAEVTREIRALGAKWDGKSGTFRLEKAKLPPEVKAAVSASAARFESVLKRVDVRLSQVLPEEIAGSLRLTDAFESSLWRADRDIQKTLKAIAVAPELTPSQAERIASEWQENMDKWIKDFTEKEIRELRQSIRDSVFKGNRYESVIRAIQRSYGVSARKAKFLASQETRLLLTKFKETRYTGAGVHEYRWGCVAGSKAHPVRTSHKELEGKIFSWKDPPITTAKGERPRRNNPGEDFNCRCFARPIVRFREKPR